MPDRLRITVTGTVQGVGFRPFVHQLASRLRLAGTVKNESASVLIDIEGEHDQLARFVEALRSNPPPLAKIDGIETTAESPLGRSGFSIEESASPTPGHTPAIFVSPDIATCEDCLAELFDLRDRRYLYPFNNCVNCGPRLTIVESTPYDRARTSMKDFPLCPECRREYEDPGNRRFHAQPIACPVCGPKLRLLDPAGSPVETTDPVMEAARAISRGRIIAIKGIGGYHLACDARNAAAVLELRRRKHRDEKPLAVMLRDLAHAEMLCEISAEEKRLLISPRRPIVLLRARRENFVAPEIAGSSPRLGVLLPYTPLHHLLLRALEGAPVVMTSGNDSEQPIAFDDEDALLRLSGIADLTLTHDRPIRLRCDDSVVQVAPESSTASFIRRSRGYAPDPIAIPRPPDLPTLAVGGQMKNTFAWSAGEHAFVSHHIGDLGELSALEAYRREIDHYARLFNIQPRVLAHDLHPDYASTRYALERARNEGLTTVAVQHHHAHLASCMAENRLAGPVIGVIFDGTGYGTDGRIWGGEFLVGDEAGFRRAAQLKYVPMPGGAQAIREPWRMALSHVLAAGLDPGLVPGVPRSSLVFAEQLTRRELNSPLTSSMGRLFDAVSSILGIRGEISYEGQAAMELETWASYADSIRVREKTVPYPFQLTLPEWPMQIDAAPLIADVIRDRERGVAGPLIAWRFHASVAAMVLEVCAEIRNRTGLNRVLLSGGVFQNSVLLRQTLSMLSDGGFEIFRHKLVPPNDGGISLGQLAVAAASMKESANVSSDPRPGD